MSEENLPVVDKEDEGRPPVDPKNKLYTVISLLIFAVLYAGWYFIKDNFTLTYALYADSLTESQMAQVMNELELSELPVLPLLLEQPVAEIATIAAHANAIYLDLFIISLPFFD